MRRLRRSAPLNWNRRSSASVEILAMNGRRLVAVIVMAVGIACCGPGPQAQETAKPIDCGTVTSLTTNDAIGGQPTTGVLIDPLFFVVVENRSGSGAVISDFESGYPYKVLIQPVRAFSTPAELQGWNCAYGSRLRFWYRECCPFATVPVTPQQLASTGDLVARLGPTSGSPPRQLAGFAGYMLFTAAGKWKISVSQGGRNLGSATFQVNARV